MHCGPLWQQVLQGRDCCLARYRAVEAENSLVALRLR